MEIIRIIFIACCMLYPTIAASFGAPDYAPDGDRPRILLNPVFLAELKSRDAANDADVEALFTWCETHKNDTGWDLPVGSYRFANFPAYVGYRSEGWHDHIVNYSLAYKILDGVDQTKADEWAARAELLTDSMIINGSVGEEVNGLQVLRALDNNDSTNNYAEKAALAAQSPNIGQLDHKNGYAVRFAATAVAVAYDWLYDNLDASQKTMYRNFLLRSIDWVKGVRSEYNNGVLWQGTRYYEDRDGPCTGTTPAGETISCTQQLDTNKHKAFAYFDPGDNFWSGFLLSGTYSVVAAFGDDPAVESRLDFIRDTWINGTDWLKARWANPMQYKGGDPSEGWSYGWGLNRIYWAFRVLKEASGEDLFSGVTFFDEAAKALISSMSSNLEDVYPAGDWTSTNRGTVRHDHVLNMASEMEYLNSYLAPTAQYVKNNASYLVNTAAGTALWQRILFSSTGDVSAAVNLPLDYLSVGVGSVNMRNSWDDAGDSVHAAFSMRKDIPGMSHDNYDPGSFCIYRGEDMLLCEAKDQQATHHSTVYFGTKGPQARNDARGPIAVPYFRSEPEFLYFKGDLTTNYTRQSLLWNVLVKHADNYDKSVLYLRPNIWVISDILKSGPQADSLYKTWYTMYPVKVGTGLTVDGATITSEVGASKLFVKTLSPVVTLTAGQDTVTTSYGRVAATTTTAQTYDHFLHVIDATDSTGTQVSSSIISGTGTIGALIDSNIAVMFTADQDGASIDTCSYTVDATTHYIADLPVNTDFDVTRDGSAIDGSPFNSGEAGMITFSAASGEVVYIVSDATPTMETSCIDLIDNDGDGNIDCEDTDCSSDPVCVIAPTCEDLIQNGLETGVDCGGNCPNICPPSCGEFNLELCNEYNCGEAGGYWCTNICLPTACPAPTCHDDIQNGDETGVDCGGSCPNPCATPGTQVTFWGTVPINSVQTAGD